MVRGGGLEQGPWNHQLLPSLHPRCREPLGPCQPSPVPFPRAITLENTLVILSTVAPDAGRYYVQAVNDKNGDNKTSQPITLAVESKHTAGLGRVADLTLSLGHGARRREGGSWERWNGWCRRGRLSRGGVSEAGKEGAALGTPFP